MTTANEVQVGGDHYKAAGVQHWDVMAYFSSDYYVGNATKYVTRWRKKNGLQDLQKAGHYLQKLTENLKLGIAAPSIAPRFTREKFNQFVQDNELKPLEAKFCSLLFFWRGLNELEEAAAILKTLEAEANVAA